MGTIMTIGGGRYDDGEILPVLKHLVSLSGKAEPNVLYVPTAGFDYIIGDEVIFDSFRQFGCKVATLFLTDFSLTPADIERKVMSADIVYVGGGNLKFLMNTWKMTGADKIFRKAYDKGIILSGYSSGAMCWCTEGWDDCGEDHSFMFIDCIDILPYCCCPHFDGNSWCNFSTEITTRKITGLAVDNGAAVVFKDDEIYALHGNDGGKAYFLSNDGTKSEEIPVKNAENNDSV